MCKFRLVFIGLFALFINLFIPFAADGKSPTETPDQTPGTTLPVLTSEEFKQTVTQLNAQTQRGLDATLSKLLGATSQPMGTAAMPAMPEKMPQTLPEAQAPASPPAENTTIATPSPPASSGSGLNPYVN